MSADGCLHLWSAECEEVEVHLGTVKSPLCVHCGAVKLVVEEEATRRARIDLSARMQALYAGAGRTNQPPPGSPPVHPFQTEIFSDV